MKNPIVSFVVPVYNCAQNLPYCLDSIAAQTYRNFEAVLVDDGSTDGSGDVCRKYERADVRFRVVATANGGVSRARNIGIQHATGTYLAFVDADDEIAPCYLDRLLDAAGDGADIVACNMKKIYAYGGDYAATDIVARRLSGHDAVDAFLRRGARQLGSSAWGKLFRNASETRFDERFKINEDKLFVAARLMDASSVALIPDELYGYYSRRGSASKRPLDNGLEDPERIAGIIQDMTERRYPELRGGACFNTYKTRQMVFHNIVRADAREREAFAPYARELKAKLLADTVELSAAHRFERALMRLPLPLYRCVLSAFDVLTSRRARMNKTGEVA